MGLKIATIEKGAPDADERYVNFEIVGGLLGFETGKDVQSARVVLTVDDLVAELERLAGKGVTPAQTGKGWAIVKDPEGREIILQT